MATNNAIDNPGNLFLVPANNLSDVANKVTSSYNLNTAGYSVFPVSGATVLTGANYGQQVVCSGATAYNVTLPTVVGNANKYIDFSIRTTSFSLITIIPASGLINGQASIILGSNESCRLETDGTNWYLSSLMMQPVNCQVFLSANQSIPDSTITKINFDLVNWDVGGFYDNVTNFRYTPLYPGKYNMNSMIIFEGIPSVVIEESYLYKTGIIRALCATVTDAGSVTDTLVCNTDVIMNGTTDYLEAFCFQNSGSPLDIDAANLILINFKRTSLF